MTEKSGKRKEIHISQLKIGQDKEIMFSFCHFFDPNNCLKLNFCIFLLIFKPFLTLISKRLITQIMQTINNNCIIFAQTNCFT